MAEEKVVVPQQEATPVASAVVLNPTEGELKEWREQAEQRHRDWLSGLREHADQ